MRRYALAALLALACAPELARAAPGDFYPGGSTLPGPKADWGACRNGDPNRCFRASDYNAFRDALGDLRLGFSSLSVFSGNVTIQGATGLTLTQGDIVMSEAASQLIAKANGILYVGTTTGSDVIFRTNNANRFTVRNSDGAFVSSGGTVTALPMPVATSDAATKGYVDASPAEVAVTPTIANGYSGAIYVRKARNGLVKLRGTISKVGATSPAQSFATFAIAYWPIDESSPVNVDLLAACTTDAFTTMTIRRVRVLGDGRAYLYAADNPGGATITCYLDAAAPWYAAP